MRLTDRHREEGAQKRVQVRSVPKLCSSYRWVHSDWPFDVGTWSAARDTDYFHDRDKPLFPFISRPIKVDDVGVAPLRFMRVYVQAVAREMVALFLWTMETHQVGFVVVPLVKDLVCSILLKPEHVMHRMLPALALFHRLEDALYWNDPKGVLPRLETEEPFRHILEKITLTRAWLIEQETLEQYIQMQLVVNMLQLNLESLENTIQSIEHTLERTIEHTLERTPRGPF